MERSPGSQLEFRTYSGMGDMNIKMASPKTCSGSRKHVDNCREGLIFPWRFIWFLDRVGYEAGFGVLGYSSSMLSDSAPAPY